METPRKHTIRIIKFGEKYVTCASCRAPAVRALLIDEMPGATCCLRHVDAQVRKAKEILLKAAETR